MPYNHLCVAMPLEPLPFIFTNTEIFIYLKTVIFGMKKSRLKFYIKIDRVFLWCLTGDSFNVTYNSLFNGRSLYSVSALPGRNQWATSGFEWPLLERSHILSSGDPVFKIANLSGPPSARLTMHLHIQWKNVGAPSFPWIPPLKLQDVEREVEDDMGFIHLNSP